ncbi:prephenate dehydrogenase [Anoxynatronum sibiricum]|uniref:Prephenate dehydrogenase n=1 Tax=Anoxynatronum sibiricum TaxID=210623 RepID=A0ABU9VY76_9CLOT
MNDFHQIAVIGLGLMGGSMAMALKERIPCMLVGYDAHPETCRLALEMALVDQVAENMVAAVAQADLVILATPVGSYTALFKAMAPNLKPGAVVTDLGSVKVPAMTAAADHLLPETAFVGGHPLAGSEKGGLPAATSTLFENAYYFLTPDEKTPETAINRLKTLVSTLGAFPVTLEAGRHDEILANTSHLPHMMASLLAATVGEKADESMTAFTGSGFRDTTRIAAGSPALWEEIFHLNRRQLLICLQDLEKKVQAVTQALKQEDRKWMQDFLEAGKVFRDQLPAAGKDYLPAWYELYVDIKDEPGALATITGVLAKAGVNIREIEILHAREGEKGAVRLAFLSAEAEQQAMKALSGEGCSFARSKGEKQDAHHQSSH